MIGTSLNGNTAVKIGKVPVVLNVSEDVRAESDFTSEVNFTCPSQNLTSLVKFTSEVNFTSEVRFACLSVLLNP